MIELSLIIVALLVSIPVLLLSVQVFTALVGRKEQVDGKSGQRKNVTILIPAHNEEPVISDTISSIKPQLNEGGRLLVVADNCTDNTARIARDSGAEVLERVDTERRGKGYALDFGINHLRTAEAGEWPDVVIVIDADCIVEDKCLDILAAKCLQTGRPVQALYLMRAVTLSPGKKIAEFAWIVKNQVRPLGFYNMGLPCQLTGTGMAFPFASLNKVNLASANIVEDMKLGIDLARQGYNPVFCPAARVVSEFPDEEKGARSQRTRWEHGHLGVIASESFGLIKDSLKNASFPLLAMALDLMVPPLALLAMILFAATVVTGLASLHVAISSLPFTIMMIACILFGLSVLLAWQGFARHVLSIKDLAGIPVYVLSKIPMYIRFWTRRQKDWIRTNRD